MKIYQIGTSSASEKKKPYDCKQRPKEPPVDIVHAFLTLHGRSDGGCVCTDQGGELASSGAFRYLLM